MTFPTYKKILINSHQKVHLYRQLDQLDFGQRPLIFDIKHLGDAQTEVIEIMAEYFIEHALNIMAYPLIILSDEKMNHPFFLITHDSQLIPSFFKHKTKQLSLKEEQKLNIVNLKQTHLQNIAHEKAQPTIDLFTEQHKNLYSLSRKNTFMQNILEQMGTE